MQAATTPQLTVEQLTHLQTKLRDAWFKVMDDERSARKYVPNKIWHLEALAIYFTDEQTRIYECLELVNRQITNLNQPPNPDNPHVTFGQALSFDQFHYGECTREIGPNGGVEEHIIKVSRRGPIKTWKTRPYEFSIPLRASLQENRYLTHENAHLFHIPENCPLQDPKYVTPNNQREVPR